MEGEEADEITIQTIETKRSLPERELITMDGHGS